MHLEGKQHVAARCGARVLEAEDGGDARAVDVAVEQADLLERVYSGCGDRVAEFVSSRRHLTLEWVIILLLAAEVVLITIDLLANRTP